MCHDDYIACGQRNFQITFETKNTLYVPLPDLPEESVEQVKEAAK